jgi:hypothetical protein
MKPCDKETVLAWLAQVRNGESEALHPFVETFVGDENIRKAATAVNVLAMYGAGERLLLPSALLLPLD